jgi:hypothetical protein
LTISGKMIIHHMVLVIINKIITIQGLSELYNMQKIKTVEI